MALALSHRLTASSQHLTSTSKMFPSLTAARMSLPVTGTTRVSSRLPRNISFVIVVANPFHETRKPRVQRFFRFSIFCLKITNSFFPHLELQFLHSTRRIAASRRNRGSALSFRTRISISSVAVRIRLVTEKPEIESKSRATSSSRERPRWSFEEAFSTASKVYQGSSFPIRRHD